MYNDVPVHVLHVGDSKVTTQYEGFVKQQARAHYNLALLTGQWHSKWSMCSKDIYYEIKIQKGKITVIMYGSTCAIGDYGAFSEKLPYLNVFTGEWMFPQANADQWVVDYKKDDKGNYVIEDGKKVVVATGFVELRSKKKPLPHQASILGSGYSGSEDGLRNFVMDELRFLHKYKASKYSGSMRKVVQMLLSKGFKQLKAEKIADGNYANPQFIFSYRFEETHGIYISQKTKEWWVIKINRNGVFYRKALWCKVSLKDREDVRYFKGYEIKKDKDDNPLEEDLQWTKIGQVSAFYQLNSMFAACGWAFNPDGNFAQNIGIKRQKMGALYETFYEMQRWKIVITEDPETGTPTAASGSVVESGVIWNSDRIANGIGHFQVPDDDISACVTFDYNLGNLAAPPGEASGPIYVYYDDTGQEIVVRSRRDKAKQKADENVSNSLTSISVYTAGGVVIARPEQMFGSDASPESVDSRPASITYTNSQATSEVLYADKYSPSVQTEGHGGYTKTWYQVVASGVVLAASFVYAFLTSNRNGFRRGGTAPNYTYCSPFDTGVDQGGWAIPQPGYVEACRLAYKTESEDQREVRTDCAGCIPYGERQAIILSSYIFSRGYTITSTTTGMIGYQHNYSYFARGPWATDLTCYNDVGDISPGPNSSPTAVHWAGVGQTDHYFAYDSTGFYHSVSINDVFVNNESGIYGIGRLRGKVGVVNSASNSVQALDWSTRQVVPNNALEPDPKTRFQYDGYGTVYSYGFSSIDTNNSVNIPHRYEFNASIIGSAGQVLELSGIGWAGVLLQDYSPDNALFVYASFDAFDGLNKHAYSHSPNSSAKVTYPGVTSYTAEGCFGFVGYEDTSNGT